MAVDLRSLRYFVAVAEQLNFTQAAARLYISQPSLSSAIRQLELSIPARLFERDTRRVRLTAAGEAMLPYARDSIEAADRAVRAAQAAQDDTPESCRMLYTVPLEPVAIAGLDELEASEQLPTMTARGVWRGEVTSELLGGRADAAVIRFPDESHGFEIHRLRGDRVCALVGDRHPLAAAEQLTVEALAAHATVRWAEGLGFVDYNDSVAGVFTDHGFEQTPFVVNRVDVPSWLPVVRGGACALIGSSERAPGGARKIALVDAPRMPITVCRLADAPGRTLIPLVVGAMQAAVDELSLP